MVTDFATDQTRNPRAARTVAFGVDGMLGGLAKWLRILGFDATYPCSGTTEERIFVTMKKAPAGSPCVRVTSTRTLGQLKEVLEKTGIQPDPRRFLSRCLVCNVPVIPVTAGEVSRTVPATVREMTDQFSACPDCGRVYWEGTHPQRMKRRMKGEGISVE